MYYVDFDGDNFGTVNRRLAISEFDNFETITRLAAFPLAHHRDPNGARERLLRRGREFESLAGQNFRQYSGIAFDSSSPLTADGRVMIDQKTANRLGNYGVSAAPFKDGGEGQHCSTRVRNLLADPSGEGALETSKEPLPPTPLNDDHAILTNATLLGFSFAEKQFVECLVDGLSPIEWNELCFEQLVLPTPQKELVQALVAEHTQKATSQSPAFDDIVKKKGKGLVLVLHGYVSNLSLQNCSLLPRLEYQMTRATSELYNLVS